MKSTEPIDTASPDPAVLELHGRAAAYSLLAHAFAHPRPGMVEQLAAAVSRQPGTWAQAVRGMARAACAGLPALERSYLHVFDPRNPPHPLEAELRHDQHGRRTAVLADLMGFYYAFAVEPKNERPDHVTCELDFVSLLYLKEARARTNGQTEQAETCRTAREAFLHDHLMAWMDAFAIAVRSRASAPRDAFYLAALDALESLIHQEKGISE